jgi:ATP-dependent helicase/nuclease subunit A
LIKWESRRIAKLILEMHGSESSKIQDAAAKDGDGWRVPQYGDIAILLPVLTHADAIEDALRELEIPYVLEGGKFYYARSEVSSAITVMRAIANPNDSVALYGSLRSVFFGLSDEDLLRAHMDGLLLDYREKAPRESALYQPFEILRDLHRHRHERRASETFETLLQKTGAREVLAARGFQSLANLNKLGRTLRVLQGAGTFSQVVDLLRTMDEEGLAESESRLMEERGNAVRVMTIHKAKGLDFPIVFVATLGVEKRARSKRLLADPRKRKIFGLIAGPADSGLYTHSWKELSDEEKRREDAELVRLLYVALTRARDCLILSTHTAGWKKEEDSELWKPDTKGTRLGPLGAFLEDCYSGKSELVRMIDVEDLDGKPSPAKASRSQSTPDWQAVASRDYEELRSLLANTPSAGVLKAAGRDIDGIGVEDRASEDRTAEAAGNRSIRLGVAFHEAMERVDFSAADDLSRLAQHMAARHRLDPASMRMLEDMMHSSLTSELLGRARIAARSNKRILREVPFVRPMDAASIEEGKIDLLFEGESGWVLVDYKTDWVSDRAEEVEEFFRRKYAAQIREYVDALRALSVKVESAFLLLARTGDAVRMI